MSTINQTVDEAKKNIRAALSLTLDEGVQPFALVGDEVTFTPEDWAWQFLSMDPEYRDAYALQVAEFAESALATEVSNPSRYEIKKDIDGSCALRFGLAAWLNPSATRLPKLLHERDSWFFPLVRPVAEDYRRNEVSGKKYVRTSPLYARHLDKYLHLVANETTFGYRRPLNPPSTQQTASDSLSNTWVAIDCSVPPEGQFLALKALALANRQALIQNGWKTHDLLDNIGIDNVGRTEVFEHMQFRRSSGATDQMGAQDDFWRAVHIDVLGPIVSQLALLLKELRTVHEALVASKRVAPPKFSRFQNTLPRVKDVDGTFRNGGSYLKALHVIAELAGWGHSPTVIARITDIDSEDGGHLHSWRHLFNEDLGKYIGDAQTMLSGGYKHLIHSRKPDLTISS